MRSAISTDDDAGRRPEPSVVTLKVSSKHSFKMSFHRDLESESGSGSERDSDEEDSQADETASGRRRRKGRARRSGDDTGTASRGSRGQSSETRERESSMPRSTAMSAISITESGKMSKKRSKRGDKRGYSKDKERQHTKKEVQELDRAITLLELEIMQRYHFGSY